MTDESDEQPPRRGVDWALILPIAILVVSTVVMIVPMVFGVELLGVSGKEGVARLLAGFADSPAAPFAVTVVFTLLGLTGFPQFLLIGGAAAIFGSLWGFVYSMIGTMVSALAGFWIGRISGGKLIKRYGNAMVHRASEVLGRRGIAASAIVRFIPSGPAIMVNMIAGASHMRAWQFAVGTFIGSLPKTALIALVGGHLGTFLRQRDPVELGIAGGALIASIVLGLYLRKRFLRSVEGEEAKGGAETAAADGSAQPTAFTNAPPRDKQ